MKRLMMFAITIFIILPLVFTCCKDEDPQPESMTFVDDGINPAKEFTIYENLEFKVRFVKAYTEMPEFAELLGKGTIVSGKINSNNKWKDDNITGTAYKMSSSNKELRGILKEMGSMEIGLTYAKTSSGVIAEVTVSFPGDGFFDGAADVMMGGTFELK